MSLGREAIMIGQTKTHEKKSLSMNSFVVEEILETWLLLRYERQKVERRSRRRGRKTFVRIRGTIVTPTHGAALTPRSWSIHPLMPKGRHSGYSSRLTT